MPEKQTIKHYLVPKHTKLTDKEKEELFAKYTITMKEMPQILVSDAAVKELDVKEGDVVKIQRNSPTAGESAYFRVVVSK